MNCTIASKLDDFVALPGLSKKYDDEMHIRQQL
jgi:hypothetical protein